MTAALLTLGLAVLAPHAEPEGSLSRTTPKHSPYAPSLPYLTKEEEEKVEKVIARFILADIGRLGGTDALRARKDFDKLGPEAIPYLIRGLNRSARIQHSCPVAVIARKLRKMLLASDDQELMEFARDEIGAGVGSTTHQRILDDLRFHILLHKNALARRGTARPSRGSSAGYSGAALWRGLSTEKLVEKAGTERKARLQGVLLELSRRKGDKVLEGFVTVAGGPDPATSRLARSLLDRRLAGEKEEEIKKRLTHEQAEVRKSAIRVVVAKYPRLTGDLIDRLDDEQDEVQDLAHRALVRLNRGVDLGPPRNPNTDQREAARKRWQLWWRSLGGR
jgi:hypothetical protein